MLDDLISIVVDVEKFGLRADRPRRKWNTCSQRHTGRFELLEPARRRREEKFPKIKKDAMQIAVQGAAGKPKKGECPNGTDPEDDPRFSAIALLAEAGEAGEQAEASEGDGEDDEDDDASDGGSDDA